MTVFMVDTTLPDIPRVEGEVYISPRRWGWYVCNIIGGRSYYLHHDGMWRTSCTTCVDDHEELTGYFLTRADAIHQLLHTELVK